MSEVVAAWIAHVVFWALIVVGIVSRELNRNRLALCTALWLAGYLGLPRISFGSFLTSYIALLDIGLVFLIFKGDVRLT